LDAATGLTITVIVDTSSAMKDVNEFQSYAMQVLEDVRAAYAAAEQELFPGTRRSV